MNESGDIFELQCSADNNGSIPSSCKPTCICLFLPATGRPESRDGTGQSTSILGQKQHLGVQEFPWKIGAIDDAPIQKGPHQLGIHIYIYTYVYIYIIDR